MSGPWEKFQNTGGAPKVAQNDGPWNKFKGTQAGTDFYNRHPNDDVVQEQHPDISVGERALVKNFSSSPDATMATLKAAHPNLEFKASDDQVQIRTPGDKAWKVLDPQNVASFMSTPSWEGAKAIAKDLPQDMLDIPYDAYAGVSEGLAGAAGGLAGIGTGPGALASASAAAGAAGAGNEVMRQGIGKLLGIPQDMNYKDAAVRGGLSAATTGLTGFTPMKGMVNNLIEKKMADGMSREAIQELIDQGQKGLVRKAWDKGPAIAGGISGYGTDTVTALKNRMSELEAIKAQGPAKWLEDTRSKWAETFNNQQRDTGKKIGTMLSNAGEDINIGPSKKRFIDHIAETEALAQRGGVEADYIKAENARNTYNDIFGIRQGDRKVVGHTSPQADQVVRNKVIDPMTQQEIKHAGDVSGGPIMGEQPIMATQDPTLRTIQGDKNSYPLIQDTTRDFDPITMTFNPKATHLPDVVDPTVAVSRRQDLSARGNWKGGGIQRPDGKSVDQSMLDGTVKSAYHDLNTAFENAMNNSGQQGADFKKARSEYKFMKDFSASPMNKFDDVHDFAKLARNLNRPTNLTQKAGLKEMDKELGTNLVKDAELYDLHQNFANPKMMPVSGDGTTSTTKSLQLGSLGAGLGYLVGHKMGSPVLAQTLAAAGGAGGGYLASPHAVKTGMRLMNFAEKQGARAKPYYNPATWNMLMEASQNKGE